jgi:LacI family transcriptional regulator
MAVTLSDVAQRAGVSISAASRVLTNAPSTRVGQATRERIHEAARDLGYRPNFAGRALKFSRSNVVALVVPDLTNAIFSELMRGVESAAIEHDYVVLLGRSEDMQPGGPTLSKLIGEGRVDGMLLQASDEADPRDLEPLLDASSPVVFINSIRGPHRGSVSLPDAAGARAATDHLLELGHHDIAFMGGLPEAGTARARETGFRDTMREARLDVRDEWVTDLGYTAQQGRAALRQVWSLSRRPTAVVVANLNAAIGVLAESRTLGINVPDDLSVVAIHDAWTAENTSPALTTVRMPLYELGRSGLEALLATMSGQEPRDDIIADPAPVLVRRDSTLALP